MASRVFPHPAPGSLSDVSLGLTAKRSTVNKWGRNADVDSAAAEDIWTQGGLHVPPTAARTHDLVSSDVADNGVTPGTGMQTVRIFGLDSAWALQQEDITLNGTTNVPTKNTYLRIFRMSGLSAGSGVINAGLITATAQTDSTVSAAIAIGDGQTQMAVYSVPTGYKALIHSLNISYNRSGGAASTIDVILMVRCFIDTTTPVLLTQDYVEIVQGATNPVIKPFTPPKMLAGPCDVFLRVVAASANNNDVSGGFDIELVQD